MTGFCRSPEHARSVSRIVGLIAGRTVELWVRVRARQVTAVTSVIVRARRSEPSGARRSDSSRSSSAITAARSAPSSVASRRRTCPFSPAIQVQRPAASCSSSVWRSEGPRVVRSVGAQDRRGGGARQREPRVVGQRRPDRGDDASAARGHAPQLAQRGDGVGGDHQGQATHRRPEAPVGERQRRRQRRSRGPRTAPFPEGTGTRAGVSALV